jgi:hypothetical protein
MEEVWFSVRYFAGGTELSDKPDRFPFPRPRNAVLASSRLSAKPPLGLCVGSRLLVDHLVGAQWHGEAGARNSKPTFMVAVARNGS